MNLSQLVREKYGSVTQLSKELGLNRKSVSRSLNAGTTASKVLHERLAKDDLHIALVGIGDAWRGKPMVNTANAELQFMLGERA